MKNKHKNKTKQEETNISQLGGRGVLRRCSWDIGLVSWLESSFWAWHSPRPFPHLETGCLKGCQMSRSGSLNDVFPFTTQKERKKRNWKWKKERKLEEDERKGKKSIWRHFSKWNNNPKIGFGKSHSEGMNNIMQFIS